MKKILTLILVLGSFQTFSQQVLTKIAGNNAYVYTPAGVTGKVPVVIFYTGLDEMAKDPSKMFVNGPSKFINEGWKPSFMVITIQNKNAWQPSPLETNINLDSVIKRFPNIDTTRIYGTGLSAGAGAWQSYVNASAAYSVRVAALVVMSAVPDNGIPGMSKYAVAGGKLWGIASPDDDIKNLDSVVRVMNRTIAGSARYTTYAGGHCCWNTFYNPTWTENGESIYDWLLKQKRGSSVTPGGGGVITAPEYVLKSSYDSLVKRVLALETKTSAPPPKVKLVWPLKNGADSITVILDSAWIKGIADTKDKLAALITTMQPMIDKYPEIKLWIDKLKLLCAQ